MIRAIAIDIDGTMTYEDRRLDIAAVEAVRRAEREGFPVIISTGNILCFAEAVAILLGTSGPLIAEDGGIVFDRASQREFVLGTRVEAERGLSALRREFGEVKQTRSSWMRLTGLTIAPGSIDIRLAMKIFSREGLSLVAVDSGFAIHIKDPYVNKGNALRKVAQILGITLPEIAAIGDAPNDLEMLKLAGLSFAVANSHEAVKRNVNHVTSKPYGEGVAEAIEKIISLR